MASEVPLISISVPVLNEEQNIETLYGRLCALAEKMADRCELEFVFSDNHSDDRTWSLLTRLAESDSRVRAIRFSKNFGFQRSILANYMHTRGDAVMQVDADLQDPPELLEAFYEKWRDGYQVVYGVRKARPEGFLLRTFRKVGYWIIDKVSEYPIPRDVGDFRLIDRKIVDLLTKIKTANPYLRGTIAGLGFNQTGIPYDRDARVAGKSKFNVNRLLRLGLTAVFNHSTVPLRAASFVGVLILTMSFVGAVYYVFLRLFNPDLPRGLASIHILVLFGIGLNSFLLGIIGEYILRIYLVLRADPVAVVENCLNMQPADLKL
jgi:dolichol-phosphate mannosyltransferase